MTERFANRVVIITGATRGIGACTAHRLHDEGACVIAVARAEGPGKALLSALGPERAHFVAGDVADEAVATRAVKVASELGGPDVLINNAAVDHTDDLLRTPSGEVQRVFATNFFGAMWMLQRCGESMRDGGGGAIVNVTSRLAAIGVPTMGVYAASKGALLALTTSAAVELAPAGVRVNAVAPGLTETPLMRDWIAAQTDPGAARRLTAETIPQGRFGRPEEVAAAIAFLASDEAAHITGASLPVDGGFTAA